MTRTAIRHGMVAIAGLAILSASMLLAGCNRSVSHAAAPATPKLSDLDSAFAAAFGSPAPAIRIVTRDGDEVTLRYRPVKLIDLGGRTALVSEARTDGCHSCSGALAVHYLTRGPSGFAVAGAWPEIVDGGSFGEPPSFLLRDDLFSGPALVASSGGTWQGCTVAYADVLELTADRPVLRAKRVLMIYADENLADGDIEGTLRPEVKDRAFAVDYSGPHARSVEYRSTGEVFEPAPGGRGLPSC
jgi:hypothetical protein